MVVAIAAVVSAVPGCSSSSPCAGLASVDQVEEAGQRSAQAALDAFLVDPPHWVDQGGWRVGFRTTEPVGSVTFLAGGGDAVKVIRSEHNGRWYVDSYRGCR